MAKFIRTIEEFVALPGNRTVRSGYCPLEFIPSEESVINAMNEMGKCFIYYHIFGGTIVTEEWDNTNSEITGPKLYNDLRNKTFVKDHHNRIENIIVSVNENPEA